MEGDDFELDGSVNGVIARVRERKTACRVCDLELAGRGVLRDFEFDELERVSWIGCCVGIRLVEVVRGGVLTVDVVVHDHQVGAAGEDMMSERHVGPGVVKSKERFWDDGGA